ncbi:hypothetical protein [Roseospira goensis]|uniref:Uncharacterized protein n=1 Tax=Roseospira goensis TaxID=391922 RepID=A0A7W6RWD4_9PROT|nr:hypothetical protein [Roseospira goensis]MBB4284435.1 hypothetical protein [Roseospira goensis]
MPPLSIADIAAALHGLSRLVRLDREGFDYFDASPTGLLKSFWVAVVLLPLYLLHLALDVLVLDIGAQVAVPRYVAVELIAYVIDWVAFPLLMLTLAPAIGIAPTVFRFLVPLNWMQLPIGLIILPLGVIVRLDAVPMDLAGFVGLMVVAASLVITALLARHALEVPWWSAAGVTILSFTISLFVNGIAFSLSGFQVPVA